MGTLNIILLVISTVVFLFIVSLFLKYGTEFSQIKKISINDSFGVLKKVTLISTLISSIFFGFFIASSSTSNQIYVNLDKELFQISSQKNWSQAEIVASDFYFGTVDYDPKKSENEDENKDFACTLSTSQLTDINGNSIWDINAPLKPNCNETLDRNNWNYPLQIQNVINNYGNSEDDLLSTIENNNPIYSIENNEYLYYFEYVLANISEKFKNTDNSFSFTFQAKTNIQETAINNIYIDNINLPENATIQLVSLEEKNVNNTGNKGAKVNELNTLNSTYRNLNDNEAYVVDFSHESFQINKGTNVEMNLNNSIFNLDVVDLVYSQEYIYPTDMFHKDQLIRVSDETWIDTDNIIIYVNESTFYNIIKSLYFNSGSWNEGVYNTYIESFETSSEYNSPKLIEYSFFLSFDYYYETYVNKDKKNYVITYTETLLDQDSPYSSFTFISDVFSKIDLFSEINNTYSLNIRNISYDNRDKPNPYPSISEPTFTYLNFIGSSTFSQYITYFNYFQTKSLISSSEDISYIFFSFVLFIGIITIFIIIAKNFKSKSRTIGILKAEGYSQSGISLLIISDIMIMLTIAVILSLALIPLFGYFWSLNINSILAFSNSLFTLSFGSFINYMFFPSMLFIGLSFLILRFYFVRKPTLKLIKDQINNEPNIFSKKYVNNSKVTNFNIHLSNINFLNSITKSFVIISIMFSSIMFLLSWLATTSIPENTSKITSELWESSNISLVNSSPDSFISQTNLSNYENAIDNDTLKDYTFTTTNSTNWEEVSNVKGEDGYCKIWNSEIYEYINNENLQNRYISKDSILYLNEIIYALPSDFGRKNDCGDDDKRREYPDYYKSLKDFNDKYYKYFDTSSNYYNQNLEGISLGYILSQNSINNIFYTAISEGSVEVVLEENGNVTFKQNFLITFAYEEYYASFNLNNKDKKIIDSYIEISKKEDGKIYFLTNIKENYYSQKSYLVFSENFSSTINNNDSDDLKIEIELFDYINLPWISYYYFIKSDPDFVKLYPQLDIFNSNEILNKPGFLPFITTNNISSDNASNGLIGISDYDFSYMPLAFVNNVDSLSNDDFKEKMRNDDFIKYVDLEKDGSKASPFKSPYIVSNTDEIVNLLELLVNLPDVDEDSTIVIQNLIELLQESSASGVSVKFPELTSKLIEPQVEVYANSLKPSSITVLVMSIMLIIILTGFIIKLNKKNTNILKTNGKNTFKIIITTYPFYLISFLIAFFLSVFVVFWMGNLITYSIGYISGIALLSIKPTIGQILTSLGIVFVVWLIMQIEAYLLTRNQKPQLYLVD